eukprot:2668675-Prymnesium_polylepis.1
MPPQSSQHGRAGTASRSASKASVPLGARMHSRRQHVCSFGHSRSAGGPHSHADPVSCCKGGYAK